MYTVAVTSGLVCFSSGSDIDSASVLVDSHTTNVDIKGFKGVILLVSLIGAPLVANHQDLIHIAEVHLDVASGNSIVRKLLGTVLDNRLAQLLSAVDGNGKVTSHQAQFLYVTGSHRSYTIRLPESKTYIAAVAGSPIVDTISGLRIHRLVGSLFVSLILEVGS